MPEDDIPRRRSYMLHSSMRDNDDAHLSNTLVGSRFDVYLREHRNSASNQRGRGDVPGLQTLLSVRKAKTDHRAIITAWCREHARQRDDVAARTDALRPLLQHTPDQGAARYAYSRQAHDDNVLLVAGYLVHSGVSRLNGSQGLRFIVQSDKVTGRTRV